MRKSEEKQALLFYENTILEALKDVESSLVAYYNEGDKLKSIEAEVLAKKEIATLEKNKYDTGLSNEIIYLENEKYYLEKRIKEIESKRTLANNLIALYKALGGGASEG